MKCGKVVVMGQPNVGKSSLLNALVGEPVSIVTDLRGTTREQIRGILNGNGYQIVFLDTPGMNVARNDLDRFMNKSISHAVAEADVICFVLDATDITSEYIQKIKNLEHKKPIIVVVNKTDKVTPIKLMPRLKLLEGICAMAVVCVSCKTKNNLDILTREIVKLLPEGPAEFSTDEYTDQSTRHMCAEIIRSELIKRIHAEIPHGIAVKITTFNKKNREVEIAADIICAKPSHKPIIIGKKGAVLKEMGIAARAAIEELIGKHVRLNTHVLVREGWKDNKDRLEEFGYKQ